MKKILSTLIICLLLSASMVLAAGSQQGEPEDKGMPEPMLLEEGSTAGQGQGEPVATAAEVSTQNQGEEKQLRVQEQTQTKQQLHAGNYMTEKGEQLKVQQGTQNRMMLKVGNSEASSSLELTQEQVQEKTQLRTKLSNGRNAEIKVMPDTASEKAQERLRLKVCNADNGCSLELKEVGKGDQVRAAYEVQAQKQSKLLGLFGKKMQVTAQVDAENGEVIQSHKPWWAFLASEE